MDGAAVEESAAQDAKEAEEAEEVEEAQEEVAEEVTLARAGVDMVGVIVF